MISRLTLATRTGLIVVLSLLAVLLGAFAIVQLADTSEADDTRPLPARIASLVSLLERSPADQHPLILRATSSRVFVATLEPGPHVGTTQDRPFLRLAARRLEEQLDALGGRPSSVTLTRAPDSATGIEYRIGLTTGDTLVVRIRSRLATRLFGLPLWLVMAAFGVLVSLIALAAMHHQTRPLARLASAVDRIDPAGPPVLLPEPASGAREIHALISAFNRLQARLSHLMRARMAMLGGISHDVRTFATRLRLRIDRIPQHAERERAAADIADMIRLLDDALLASRAGAGELSESLVEFDDVVRTEVEDRRAEGKAVELHIPEDSPGAVVLGDRLALRRIVANLVDNALKYGQAVHLSLAFGEQTVVLNVDDRGPGIPPEHREAVLEPFVRLETSRNRRTGGAGLGLAVVRSLVEAHGGTLSIEDAPAGGARVVVRLPLCRI